MSASASTNILRLQRSHRDGFSKRRIPSTMMIGCGVRWRVFFVRVWDVKSYVGICTDWFWVSVWRCVINNSVSSALGWSKLVCARVSRGRLDRSR